MSQVVLGVRVIKNEYKRIKLDNIDLNGKVELLRETASQKINKAKQELELIYAGLILEDGSVLSSYGIKPGVTVHVLEKKITPVIKKPKALKESEILQLVSTVEEFGYRNVLQKLSRPEILQKILAAAPNLTDDPAVIAILQDPELLATFADPATLRKVLQVHPVLSEALPQIIAFMKENAAAITQNQAGTSSGYSYSLEALSDDEDMDSNETARDGHALTRNSSYNAITAAQLAAAIASATTNFSSTGQVINSNGPATNNLITTEMFGTALQQAFASAPAAAAAAPASSRGDAGETMEAIKVRLQPQLQQMKEMGLICEAQNIRALQATSGDVQAAVELVFSGVID